MRDLSRPRNGQWSGKPGWRRIPDRLIRRLERCGMVDIIAPSKGKLWRARLTPHGEAAARTLCAVRS